MSRSSDLAVEVLEFLTTYNLGSTWTVGTNLILSNGRSPDYDPAELLTTHITITPVDRRWERSSRTTLWQDTAIVLAVEKKLTLKLGTPGQQEVDDLDDLCERLAEALMMGFPASGTPYGAEQQGILDWQKLAEGTYNAFLTLRIKQNITPR